MIRHFSGLTSAAIKGGQAMYGAHFYANKHASWFGIDEDLSTATYDLSTEVVHSLLHDQPLQAARQLETQLMHDQTNLFALRIAHDLHKRNGATGHLTGSIPRVLPFWDGNLSGYRSLLGLHSASLVEGAVWGPAEEAGMRALSEVAMPSPGDGPSHDVVAVNALCDLFYLCGRSREGLRFLREISIERGPERSDQHLDPAIAVARAIFYMDVGSKDLALHQLDMALGVVPELDLDGLTRLTSAMWRAHCSYFIHDNNDPKEREEWEEREEQEEDQALHRPMWSRVWTQWRKHGKTMDVNEGDEEEWSTNRRQSGLQFGPVHAALATLVYGRLTPGAMDHGNGSEGDDVEDAEDAEDAEDVEEEQIDHDLFDLWSLGDKGEMGKEQRQHTRQVYTGLLASSRGGQDKKAFDILSQYEYTWTNTVGGESIHRKSFWSGLVAWWWSLLFLLWYPGTDNRC